MKTAATIEKPSSSSSSRGPSDKGNHAVYTKIKEIGKGSFGKAILVKDAKGKELVIKTVDMSRMTAADRQSALNEAKILETLRPHPCVIRFHRSFEQDKHLCLVMDFASGGDLSSKIQAHRKKNQYFPEERILAWFAQLCLGIIELHTNKILHRDLKSQNIFLSGHRSILVGDFGIAKILEGTMACAKTSVGTPYYISPEMCLNQPYSYPSDVWALGCILFELASLRLPIQGDNLPSLTSNILHAPIPDLPSCYSEDLKSLQRGILERDPTKRLTLSQIINTPIMQKTMSRMLQKSVGNTAAIVKTE